MDLSPLVSYLPNLDIKKLYSQHIKVHMTKLKQYEKQLLTKAYHEVCFRNNSQWLTSKTSPTLITIFFVQI